MSWLLIGAAVLGVLACVASVVFCRRDRAARAAERRSRAAQRELLETLQVTRSEPEAHELLERHAHRALPGSSVTYVETREPCAAVRLAREYRRAPDSERLLACDRCGRSQTATICIPALAGGEAIGSLLVEYPRALEEHELSTLREAVAGAASAFANLRNLAAAETRAATDPLSGLPNSRALRDALKRMVAQAGRAVSSLSVILLDLDRFRQINDTFGHELGDDVLAAVGALLPEVIRASDYAGRYGGAEFLVVLPETDREGAAVLAEKLRRAIARTTVPGVDQPLSASLGVAGLPADGGDGDSLVRLAERALVAAKAAGGNRVEAAGLSIAPTPEPG